MALKLLFGVLVERDWSQAVHVSLWCSWHQTLMSLMNSRCVKLVLLYINRHVMKVWNILVWSIKVLNYVALIISSVYGDSSRQWILLVWLGSSSQIRYILDWVMTQIHRRSTLHLSMSCIWISFLVDDAILLESIFLLLKFYFIYSNWCLDASILGTVLLRTWISEPLRADLTWYHWQVIVVKILERCKLIFIHFFFDISHVSISFQGLPALNLRVKPLFVHQHSLALLISLIRIELIVHQTHMLCFTCICLALGLIISHFLSLVHVHLL